jgi:hypothetical protein
MILVNLVESFERYLKEVAAACVDHLARFVIDGRFNAFRVQGSALAAQFGTDTLGRSLWESMTWLDCDEVNERHRRLLSPPFESGNFLAFPEQPAVNECSIGSCHFFRPPFPARRSACKMVPQQFRDRGRLAGELIGVVGSSEVSATLVQAQFHRARHWIALHWPLCDAFLEA